MSRIPAGNPDVLDDGQLLVFFFNGYEMRGFVPASEGAAGRSTTFPPPPQREEGASSFHSETRTKFGYGVARESKAMRWKCFLVRGFFCEGGGGMKGGSLNAGGAYPER